MRTAEEMIEFARIDQKKDLGDYWKIAFGEVEKILQNNEIVKYTCTVFSGGHTHDTAVVVTDKRIIFGGVVGGFFKNKYGSSSYSIKNINSINATLGKVSSKIFLDTLGEDIVIEMIGDSEDLVNDVKNKLWDAIESGKQSAIATPSTLSAADELKKFKELLDSGVITQEEFDAKKKQLLGL